ncbi:MAG: hypothetical protein V4547_16780 [Bacteroidota bacterium]
MKKELKQAIINFIFDNEKDYQLTNLTVDKFREYIYSASGDYLIGGEDVKEFISKAITLLTN